jgi:hypothetical protein
MDTQLSINNDLVSRIEFEALSLGLYEAFLEAAPQFIFQLSIVLRVGYISKNFIVNFLRSFTYISKIKTKNSSYHIRKPKTKNS